MSIPLTLTLQDCWGFETLAHQLAGGDLILRRLPTHRQLQAMSINPK